MSLDLIEAEQPRAPAAAAPVPALTPLDAAIDAACARIAPVWPLKSFVAVNPFLGFVNQPFEGTCALMRRVAGVDVLMPRAFYRDALADGRISDRDLADALTRRSDPAAGPTTPEALRREAARDAGPFPAAPDAVATVAEVLDGLASRTRRTSLSAFMVEEISRWCAARFDEGQAAWRLPMRHLSPYAAWRATMRHDLNPEAMGVRGFRHTVASLPDNPREAIAAVLLALGVPEAAWGDYLFRALFDVRGWAAVARQRRWAAELDGRADDAPVEVLAIRVVWGFALFASRTDAPFREAWSAATARTAAATPRPRRDDALAVDLILHEAYELAGQRQLVARLAAPVPRDRPGGWTARPPVQAAFCIDVRSEVFRRAFEKSMPAAQTLGFAGFFGFAIDYLPLGLADGSAQCPVLLKPAFTVCEEVQGVSGAEEARLVDLRRLRRRAGKAWKAFKLSAVSSFAFVEAAGLSYAAKLVGDGAGLSRPVAPPREAGLDPKVAARLRPALEPSRLAGRDTGITPEQRLDAAHAALRGMSLTEGFAPLVALIGHGSTSVNNPHAAGLDCGACGGHTGEANARVAAAVLNDPAVRIGLIDRGVVIPRDTWFVAALHDTTTDEVRLFADGVPTTHHDSLAALRGRLAEASGLARAERARLLGVRPGAGLEGRVRGRSWDWSQVRPEWGLAAAAAFIAAPRSRTRHLDLKGRAFLHDYEWRADDGFKVLELIMTAPMIVASWISLQYFGSTTNNAVFGSGNKTLHNVVGQLGVLEGNGGDLRPGLPMQSVHDGACFVHEPVRLAVFLAAPTAAIDGVLAAHTGVRQLVENGWVRLFALDDAAGGVSRRCGDGGWRAAETQP